MTLQKNYLIYQVLFCLLLFPSFTKALDPKKALSQMTLEEKAAQLVFIAIVSHEEKNQGLMAAFQKWADYDLSHAHAKELIVKHKVGGIIYYGNDTFASEQVALTKELQALSSTPLFVTLDAETGLHNRLAEKSVMTFPRAMTLGAIVDMQLIYKHGYELGQQLKKIGVHWAFSPVADVNCNPANPVIGYRSFGSDQESVAEHAIAFMQGLQDAGIIACAKHFPGHGDTTEDSHELLPKITHNRHRLEYVELYPFQKLIDAGIKSIMLAHLEIPAFEKKKNVPSSLSYAIATTLLQGKMGFKGLVVTDCMGMKGVTDKVEPEEAGIRALEAGNHIVLCPPKPVAAIKGIVNAVKTGRMSQEKLDEIVLKVLEAKAWAIDQQKPDYRSLDSVLHSRQAYELKQELYAKAVTLIKADYRSTLSFEKDKKIVIIVGDKTSTFEATLDRFGIAYHHLKDNLLEDTTLTEDSLKQEQDDAVLSSITKYDHVVVSIHHLNHLTAKQRHDFCTNIGALITQLKKQNKRITVVSFASPYSIALFKKGATLMVDNLIIAYENEPEAQVAVAEILYGRRNAEGRLPI